MERNLVKKFIKKVSVSLLCFAMVITTLTGTQFNVKAASAHSLNIEAKAEKLKKKLSEISNNASSFQTVITTGIVIPA